MANRWQGVGVEKASSRRSRGRTWLILGAVFGLALLDAAPAASQPAGLVAAWSFNEGSGTVAGDASGLGHVGAVSNATWTPNGRFGAALTFNGTNAWVTVGDSPALDLSTGMTVMAWIRPTTSSGVRDIVVKEGSGADHYNLYYRNWRGRPESNVRVNGANRTAEGTALPANTWTHVAGTHDGAVVRLFVNGIQVQSGPAAGSIPASSGPLRIGGNSLWGEFFAGVIDEVRVYNRALTATQIQSDMSTPIAPLGASQIGQWSGPVPWPLVTVHAALLRTGQVLAWDADPSVPPRLWDPGTGTLGPVPSPASNIFCSGHAMLADGRLLVVGGHIDAHVGITDVNLYDPATQDWTSASPMSYARWYPTATTLPDGRLLATSGEVDCFNCEAEIPEIYDPTTGVWEPLAMARQYLPFYPYVFVLPDGRLLAAGSAKAAMATRVLDLATRSWTLVDPAIIDGGSAAMYLPGRIMKSGTSANSDPPYRPSVATTHVLDMLAPAPGWRQASPMAFPRAYHTLTSLPDGSVLATGGGRTTDVFAVSSAVYEAELWSPESETWTTMASMQTPRLYHSIALLLPDGRVLVTGSGRWGVDQLSAEVYSPPYLFRGARPTITSVPNEVTYGSDFAVSTPDASRIAKVSLIRPGSVTHTLNQDQRFVPLTFQAVPGGLTVQAPDNPNLAPPGFYMLFVVDGNGVPSVASFVQLPRPAGGGDPLPGGLVAAYSFSEGAGTVTADSSGNGHHGVVSGASWTNAGRHGGALSFDGTNDWVTVPGHSQLDFTTGMTLAAWVYPTAHGSGRWRNVLIKERAGGEAYNLYSNTAQNRPAAYVAVDPSPGAPVEVRGTSQLPLNTWTHLATTYDGAVLRLFVNGSEVASRALTGSIMTAPGPLRIGGNSIWGEFFKGRIDEVRLYDRPLSSAEISEVMSTPLP